MSETFAGQVFFFSGHSLDPSRRMLFGRDGQHVPLPSRAFDALLYMVEHPGDLLEKRALMKAVWPDIIVEENNLNQNVMLLRRSLGEEAGEHRYIVTVPGRGFRFVAPVEVREAQTAAMAPTAATPGVSRKALRRSTLWLSGFAAAALLLFVIGYFLWTRPAQPTLLPTGTATEITAPSIAVLAFEDLSPNKDQEYFSDGLSDELLNQLGQMRQLRVIGRTSSFSFKGKHEDLRTIGQALGVNHLLEGSVRKAGGAIRVDAQLVNAKDGSQEWSGTYDRKLDDVFTIQEEISKSVAGALTATLRVGEEHLGLGGTRNPDAYDAYLAAVAHIHRGQDADLSPSISQLERAVQLDPEFALAWSTLAERYGLASINSFNLADAATLRQKSLRAGSRALELAPDSPRVLVAAAQMSGQLRDWGEAERRLKKAAALASPTDYDVNASWGGFLESVGRTNAALPYFQRAVKAEPLDREAYVDLDVGYLGVGNLSSAEAQMTRDKRDYGRDDSDAGMTLLIAMARRDRAAIDRLSAKDLGDLPARAYRLGRDNPAAGVAELKRLLQDPRVQGDALGVIAHWAVYFDDDGLALTALRTEFGPSSATFSLWTPDYKTVRRLPGFKDIVRDLGLVDYWRDSGKWSDFCHPLGPSDFECN